MCSCQTQCVDRIRTSYVNPLVFTSGWHPSMLKYCMMHTLHLGILHFVNGGAFITLSSHDFFGTLEMINLKKNLGNWFTLAPPDLTYTKKIDLWTGVCRGGGTVQSQLEILTLRFRRWVTVNSIPNHGKKKHSCIIYPCYLTEKKHGVNCSLENKFQVVTSHHYHWTFWCRSWRAEIEGMDLPCHGVFHGGVPTGSISKGWPFWTNYGSTIDYTGLHTNFQLELIGWNLPHYTFRTTSQWFIWFGGAASWCWICLFNHFWSSQNGLVIYLLI